MGAVDWALGHVSLEAVWAGDRCLLCISIGVILFRITQLLESVGLNLSPTLGHFQPFSFLSFPALLRYS